MEVLKTLDALATEEWTEMAPPALLEALIAGGEAVVPALLERITEDALRARNNGEIVLDHVAYQAIFALCELALPETAEPVFHACFELGDEDILEWLDNSLWKFGPTTLPHLERISCNKALEWYPRASALSTYHKIVLDDPVGLARYGTFLKDRLRTALAAAPAVVATEPDDDITTLVDNLVELRDPEARPLLTKAFARKLVDDFMVTEEDAEELYANPKKVTSVIRQESFLQHYRDWHLGREIEKREQEAKRVQRELEESRRLLAGIPVRVEKKPGRNELCWCGSGKKYKKCHLDKDQGR